MLLQPEGAGVDSCGMTNTSAAKDTTTRPNTAKAGSAARPKLEGSQFDRRRGPGRRRTDYRRDAEEGHMNEEQLELLKAIDEYKRANDRPFPTWTEVLDVVLYLGYRKVAPIGEFKLSKGRQTPLREPGAKKPPSSSADAPDEEDAVEAEA